MRRVTETSNQTYADLWLPPEDDPRSADEIEVTDERSNLMEYLRANRLTLQLKCEGLTPEQLATRSIPPSTLSLLGLLRHMADVELGWFRQTLAGEDTPRIYRTAKDRDADFNGAVADQAVVDKAWADWREQVAFAEQFVANASTMDVMGTRGGEQISLREVLVHMVEEYARHNGHADLLRECIDGRTGQ